MAIEKRATQVKTRKEWLDDFGSLVDVVPDEDQLVEGIGEYLVFHFDLVQPEGTSRTKAREAIAVRLALSKALQVGGSVHLVPAADAYPDAIVFWNRLSKTTAGGLIEGDSFYLHYSGDKQNSIGGIAQVVPPGSTTLVRVAAPALPPSK